MSVPPETLRVARQWVERAEEDLTNAEYTLTLREKCPLGTVCFHAQQCGEKYLKARLTLLAVPFPRTHDPPEPLLRVPEDLGLRLQPSDVGILSRYSIEARYPGDWEPIARVEAEDAVTMARKVREASPVAPLRRSRRRNTHPAGFTDEARFG